MGLIKMVSFLRLARFSNTLIGNLAILIDGSNPSSPNLKKTIVEIIHKANVIHHDGVLDIDYYPKKIILANINDIVYGNKLIYLIDKEKNINYTYSLNELTIMCRIKLFIKWMVLQWANGKIW
jgi:hypothetical protein